MLQTTVDWANLGSTFPRRSISKGDVCAVQTGGFYGNSGLVTDRTLHHVCTVGAMHIYFTNFWEDLEGVYGCDGM